MDFDNTVRVALFILFFSRNFFKYMESLQAPSNCMWGPCLHFQFKILYINPSDKKMLFSNKDWNPDEEKTTEETVDHTAVLDYERTSSVTIFFSKSTITLCLVGFPRWKCEEEKHWWYRQVLGIRIDMKQCWGTLLLFWALLSEDGDRQIMNLKHMTAKISRFLCIGEELFGIPAFGQVWL
jgi:hypothetical protein